eukprot:UN30469
MSEVAWTFFPSSGPVTDYLLTIYGIFFKYKLFNKKTNDFVHPETDTTFIGYLMFDEKYEEIDRFRKKYSVSLVIDKQGQTIMHYAVLLNSLKEVFMIAQKYPELIEKRDKARVSPLLLAVQHGYLDIVKFLIEKC